MTKLHEISNLGQSIWLDHIDRLLLETGELDRLIAGGLRGMTSNPTIFEQAIGGSDAYDDQLRQVATGDATDHDVYEALAIADIQRAADAFRTIYEQGPPLDRSTPTRGQDGYVSLEANPHLARDTDGTIEEVLRLHERVDRPNVMFKVPATPEGIPAITELIARGININVTLMFSIKHYDQVVDAYLGGLERLAADGGDLGQVASVASFFVSRVDGKLDPRLPDVNVESLQGQIGIANAKTVYLRFKQLFGSARWKRLANQGARVQRVLWGSTSTKNPEYSDTLYVDSLIGPHTINTVPLPTLEAFMDHGSVRRTIDRDVVAARNTMEQLRKATIDIIAVGDELLGEGVDKFVASYDSLITSIAAKREQVAAS